MDIDIQRAMLWLNEQTMSSLVPSFEIDVMSLVIFVKSAQRPGMNCRPAFRILSDHRGQSKFYFQAWLIHVYKNIYY